MNDDIGGVWRTVGGRRIFIKDGQDLATAMKESGKFKNKIDKKDEKVYNKPEDFNCLKKYENLNDEEYKKSYSSHNDYILEEMAKENGFDKLPTKVNSETYDRLIKEGNIRIQRVISDDANNTSDYYINEFKNGKYYATGTANMYGSGIYTSANVNDINTYSKRNRNSKVMEMVIDKNAKIKTFKNQSDMYNYVVSELKNMDAKYHRCLEDTGRVLVSKGYDVSYIEDANYYVIYNRTKIYVKE